MIVEVKIQCDCGTRYKFDVEPLNGRMPQKVGCPHCGVDGTPAANALLRAKLQPAAAGPDRKDRFGPGLAGAAAAAAVAMLAWSFLIKATGHPLGFAAWGVGLLVGMGARGLGRDGSRRLGVAAGACAFIAILVGQLLAARIDAGDRKAGFSGGGVGWLTLVWLLMAVLSAFKLASSRTRVSG
jgi:hypothetical protein